MNSEYPEESVDLVLTVTQQVNELLANKKIQLDKSIGDETKKNKEILKAWHQGENSL